jgi:hypothetical protein
MEASRPGSISVDDFTEATFKAVLRAAEARKVDPELRFPQGPILYGIVWWPEGGGPPVFGPPQGPIDS